MRAASVAATVFVVLAVVFTVAHPEFSAFVVLMSALASLALVVGAYFAPAGYTNGVRGLALTGDARWQKIKSLQLVAGAVAAGAAVFLFLDNAGTSAILGIVIAMLVGAFGPSLVPQEGGTAAETRA